MKNFVSKFWFKQITAPLSARTI